MSGRAGSTFPTYLTTSVTHLVVCTKKTCLSYVQLERGHRLCYNEAVAKYDLRETDHCLLKFSIV